MPGTRNRWQANRHYDSKPGAQPRKEIGTPSPTQMHCSTTVELTTMQSFRPLNRSVRKAGIQEFQVGVVGIAALYAKG